MARLLTCPARRAIAAACLLVSLCHCAHGRAGRGQTAAGPVDISFDLYKNLIIVGAMIDGKGPFDMMLDTGTDPSAIDLATARQIGLGPAAAGEEKDYDTALPVVVLGDLRAEKVEAAATDLSGISAALGRPLHGVLGHSFLNGRIVQIDFPRRHVRFLPRPLPPTAGTVLPFHYTDNSILLDDVAVNGNRVTTLFDTGFNGTFNVMPAAIPALHLEKEFDSARPKKSVGYSGASTNREGTIQRVEIGALSVDAPTVIFWEKGTGHDSTSYGFTIGNGFLKDFVVTIDYPRGVITLQKP